MRPASRVLAASVPLPWACRRFLLATVVACLAAARAVKLGLVRVGWIE